MKTFLVLQYDNRYLNSDYVKLCESNKKYCEKNNYEYKFLSTKYNLPHWWIKVHIINSLINTDNYKGIVWLDTDACIYDSSILLENLILENKSFYLSPDNIICEAPFNAGVFIVLNTRVGKQIMSDWMNCYNPNCWKKDRRNNFHTYGTWAGVAYEQGSFCKRILPKYLNHIQVYDWHFLQSTYTDVKNNKNNPFTLHFATDKAGIREYVSILL